MATWKEFANSVPDLASFGKKRLHSKVAYLATSRRDGSPRVHPVSPFIADGHLYVYMEPTSPKGKDLRSNPWYALHCSVEDNAGGQGEILVRGQARVVEDNDIRETREVGGYVAAVVSKHKAHDLLAALAPHSSP